MRIKLLIMTLAFSLSAIAQGKSELDVFKGSVVKPSCTPSLLMHIIS